MAPIRWFALGLTAVLIVCASRSSSAEDEREVVDVRSAYLAQSLLHGHQIHLRGALGGTGVLTVDPNVCSTNEFGDPTRCTRRAPMRYDVTLKVEPLEDPRRLGRRIVGVRGKALPKSLRVALVMGGRKNAPPRLILTDGNARQIITMAGGTTTQQAEPNPPAIPMPGKPVFQAYQSGKIVTLEVRGSHPSAGYTTTLERHPGSAHHYRLVHTPPKGAAATVITPYSLIRSFRSATPVTTIRVTDGSGTHAISVEQRARGR